jgi:hypothetical protein
MSSNRSVGVEQHPVRVLGEPGLHGTSGPTVVEEGHDP